MIKIWNISAFGHSGLKTISDHEERMLMSELKRYLEQKGYIVTVDVKRGK